MKNNSDNLNDSKVPPLEGFREAYTLHLADNVLILAQQNSAWCGHGPVLEQDIAITNISLDLLGQARNFYQYAAQLINESKAPSLLERAGGEATEDTLAYLRDNREFKNCLLVEQENGDWAKTILRQFLFSNYQYLLYEKLQDSEDEQLKAIAVKALKEVIYHLKWSSEWVIRLGDGTDESHQRMSNAIVELWPYIDELFINADYESALIAKNISVDVTSLKTLWLQRTQEVFSEATLTIPGNIFMQRGGKQGVHTEHLGYILAEMQFLQRAYPDSVW
jgi:ring-1,2-phenylacetyl-CoA epoxidase subunit PaaC